MNQIRKGILVSALLGLTGTAWAAGFQIQEQNATNLGLAYSGTAVLAEDASTAFYNPAGLNHIEEKELSLSGVLIQSTAELTPSYATNSLGGSIGLAKTDPGGLITVPGLYYAARINSNLMFGLAVAAPFGLKTAYDGTSSARYLATESSLKVIDISPSLSYQIGKHWNVALGFDSVYGRAVLNQNVGLVGDTPARDMTVSNHFHDWATSWHAGVLFEPNNDWRFGLTYRNKISFSAEGLADTYASGVVTSEKIMASLTLPETMTGSILYRCHHKMAMMVDVQWTKWDRFKQLRINYEPPKAATVINENFKNTIRVALGMQYEPNDKWAYRVGVASDRTPTNDINRTARIPDEDRTWVAVGLRYRPKADLKLDMGYARLFFKRTQLNDTGKEGSLMNLRGVYNSNANLLGVQVSWSFA